MAVALTFLLTRVLKAVPAMLAILSYAPEQPGPAERIPSSPFLVFFTFYLAIAGQCSRVTEGTFLPLVW